MEKQKEEKVEEVSLPEVTPVAIPTKVVFEGVDPGDGSTKSASTYIRKVNGKAVEEIKSTLFYNFGSALTEMVKKFGEGVVFSQAKAQMKVRLQAAQRACMAAGDDVEALASKFIPGVAMERTPQDPAKVTDVYFDSLSDAEQDALIEKLRNKKK